MISSCMDLIVIKKISNYGLCNQDYTDRHAVFSVKIQGRKIESID